MFAVSIIISTLLLAGLNLVAPRLMSEMTSLVAQGLNHDGMRRVLLLAALSSCLYLLRILFRYLSNFMAH